MAISAKIYGLFLKSLANKEINLNTDSIKVMLCTSAYVPNQDTHQYKSSITNEITGTGYTAGGVALGSVVTTYTAASNTLMLDAADAIWATATFTARYAVIYDATPATDATRPLIAYVDFGADVQATAAEFKLSWDALGIVSISAS